MSNKANLQHRKTNASDPIEMEARQARRINSDYTKKYGFSDTYDNDIDIGVGIDEKKVIEISKFKGEPEWMLKRRIKAFRYFEKAKTPSWGADLSGIDFDSIHYFVRATDRKSNSWEEVPEKIKDTFEKLGIPQAERKFLESVFNFLRYFFPTV